MTYTELNNTLYPSGDVFATLLLHNFVPPIAYMVRRESLLQVGLYDETIRGVDDYDLMVRLAAHFHFRFINHPVANYRLHSEMSTLNIPERFTRDTVRLREKGFAMDAFARLSRRQQAQAYAVQGTTYMQLDKFAEARSWYVKALRTDPAFLRAYAQYLLTWLGKSVFERVVRLYRGQRNMQSLHDIANDLPPQA